MRLVQTSWNVTRSSVAMSGFGPASARSFSSGLASNGSEAWRRNLITDPHNIAKVMSDDIWPVKPGDQHLPCCSQIAGQAKSVAVIGIETKDKAFQPAYFVPEALACKVLMSFQCQCTIQRFRKSWVSRYTGL